MMFQNLNLLIDNYGHLEFVYRLSQTVCIPVTKISSRLVKDDVDKHNLSPDIYISISPNSLCFPYCFRMAQDVHFISVNLDRLVLKHVPQIKDTDVKVCEFLIIILDPIYTNMDEFIKHV